MSCHLLVRRLCCCHVLLLPRAFVNGMFGIVAESRRLRRRSRSLVYILYALHFHFVHFAISSVKVFSSLLYGPHK